MKNKLASTLLLATFFFGFESMRSLAQETTSTPTASTFIFITHDVIKQGGFAEYERLQQEKAKALKAANWQRVSIGLTHVTGPIKTNVFHYSFYKSFEDYGNDRKELGSKPELKKALKTIEDEENAILVSRDIIAAVYHPDISYQGDFNWADMRYLSVIVNVLKPGHSFEYLEKSAIVKNAHTAGKIVENRHLVVGYQVHCQT